MEEKTHVAVRGKNEKTIKLPQTITFSSELIFGKMNSQWKGIEEEKPSINPKF
jgi:hypothetical protein